MLTFRFTLCKLLNLLYLSLSVAYIPEGEVSPPSV